MLNMKNPLVFLATSALLALPAAAQDPRPQETQPQETEKKGRPKVLDVGGEVPKDLTLFGLDGKPVRFGDLRGKTVVVHFWSIVCPWEKQAEPKMMAIADSYGDQDVVVLAINANAPEIGAKPEPEAFAAEDDSKRPYGDIRAHVEDVQLNHRVLVDHTGDVGRFFQAKTTPHCFVIDPKGVLRYQGALDNDPRDTLGDEAETYVRDAIDAVLAGREVETTATKPYG